jgi:hypothetical protein
MPRENYPSSYICDCGQESHHFERTIRQLKAMSRKTPQSLVADDGEHAIVFHHGRAVAMFCPKVGSELPIEEDG